MFEKSKKNSNMSLIWPYHPYHSSPKGSPPPTLGTTNLNTIRKPQTITRHHEHHNIQILFSIWAVKSFFFFTVQTCMNVNEVLHENSSRKKNSLHFHQTALYHMPHRWHLNHRVGRYNHNIIQLNVSLTLLTSVVSSRCTAPACC